MALAASCALLAIIAWLILRAVKQGGQWQQIAPVAVPPAHATPSLGVIVPARDEAANIGRCLRALVSQTYPVARLRILVVDDHSSDATFSIARSIAQSSPQVSVLRSAPLPAGWTGKSRACWIAACALPAEIEWLCFIDADVWAEPPLLASALAAVSSERIDLLSVAPRQELGSFAERLIMPCGLYLLAFCQDLRRSRAADVSVTGQCMLVRAAAYRAAGGHAAVRGEICEDLALARRIKDAGGKVVMRDGDGLLATRMYGGWRTLRPGLAKNLIETRGGPLATALLAAGGMLLAWAIWLLPLADGLACGSGDRSACIALGPALVALLAALGLHLAGANYFRIPLWYGLLFPIGYSAGARIAADSLWWRWRGRVSWKGRTYP